MKGCSCSAFLSTPNHKYSGNRASPGETRIDPRVRFFVPNQCGIGTAEPVHVGLKLLIQPNAFLAEAVAREDRQDRAEDCGHDDEPDRPLRVQESV